jgi:L-amino acid N-acyltransferase YncA
MPAVNNSSENLIRDATDADMAVIQEIYAHHVLEGLASFEETPPDEGELIRRRDALVADGYPYRVCEDGGIVKGYAYAGPFRPRPAYIHTVENSVYVSPDAHRQGIGRRLLEDLIERCTELGYRQMVAIIGDSGNLPSIGLHASLGFEMIGVQPSVGFKFGRWVDSVTMQLALGKGDTVLPDA